MKATINDTGNLKQLTILIEVANISAIRNAGLREKIFQIRKAYKRGRTLDITNKPALRIAGVNTSVL